MQRNGLAMQRNGREGDGMIEERSKAIDLAIGQIEKQFGRGAIMRLGEQHSLEIEAVPTGSLSLDIALGIGGVPRGRITELFGPESSGKSTLCQHIIAEAQKLGGLAAYIDVEHALEPTYARAIGVKVDDLLVSQPDTGEQALEIAEALVRSNAVDVVVIDSVAALVPRAEIEGEMGDSLPGLQARLMSQALRKLTGAIAKTSTAVIFVNQLREKVGVVFGNPEVTPGGRALKFYSSVRIDIRRIESLKQGQQVVGNRVRTRVVKNKVAPPFRTAEFDMMFTGRKMGISREGDVLDLGAELNVLKKMGAFYSYGELRLGQGRENARNFLIDNPSLTEEIETLIRVAAAAAPPAPAANGSRPGRGRDVADDEDEDEEDEP
jgi:recombination protein RecA